MTTINAQINTPQKIYPKSITLVTAASVGLGNVDNTSDIDKPISTLAQTALDLKADQSTTYTKTEVDTNIANLVNSAPETLDTLNELAAALNNDENFATTVTDSIALNTSDIATNTSAIATNAIDIGTNTGNITTNTGNIAINTDDIAVNAVNISTNASDISTINNELLILEQSIDDNENTITGIGDVVGYFEGNLAITNSHVDNNTADIATNTAAIATNAADIDSIVEYPYTTDFQSGVEQTRNLTTITYLEGYQGNQNLTDIYIGSNVTSIGYGAFQTDDYIKSVTIANGLISIADYAFEYCIRLTDINIPNTVTTIGEGAFYGTAVENIIIPDSVTSLGIYAFFESRLKTVVIGDGLTALDLSTFRDCDQLTSVTLGANIVRLRNDCFRSCTSLTSIVIPDTVARVEGSCFRSCSALQSITLPTNPSFTTLYNTTFRDCSALSSIDIPESITTIQSNIFLNCTSLSTINCYATSAPSIGTDVFTNVAATEIHVPVGATGYGTTYGGLEVVADL